ncbi:hypothetical protein PbB2_02070 [Candidatus Phycosocius bacilliformis]|uniref:Uncharacterized protein n=1 Tax=Candidatus Phycosocius bacilliformis TaxID=1445552 RepID=A0A2P2EBH7_9PROT|nr:hypothetical protein [Candidatus Phycosocius bacilliformis]GBF58389.1 hypothetical protein PbB2_02070 [Candidatus Phycosocius bacilliformis]
MSEMNKPLAAAMRAMAERALDPRERLGFLKSARDLDPTDVRVLEQIKAIERQILDETCYVAIEQAIIVGEASTPIEGCIYMLQPDRSLKPLNGRELRAFHERHPNFARYWRL